MRRNYGRDFKREVVRLSYEPGQTVQKVASELEELRMGYYSWRRRAEARRVKQKAEDRLVEQIAAIQQRHRKRYGATGAARYPERRMSPHLSQMAAGA